MYFIIGGTIKTGGTLFFLSCLPSWWLVKKRKNLVLGQSDSALQNAFRFEVSPKRNRKGGAQVLWLTRGVTVQWRMTLNLDWWSLLAKSSSGEVKSENRRNGKWATTDIWGLDEGQKLGEAATCFCGTSHWTGWKKEQDQDEIAKDMLIGHGAFCWLVDGTKKMFGSRELSEEKLVIDTGNQKPFLFTWRQSLREKNTGGTGTR